MHKYVLLTIVCLLMGFMAEAQEFNIENEYAKQRKRYPFISPYRADSVDVNEIINIEYKKADNRNLQLDIFLPQNANAQMPTLCIVHGGGWRSGNKTMDWPIAKSLANRGIACVCIDYRKSDVALYPAALNDVEDALKWIYDNAEAYHFDRNCINVSGTSAGGQLAALAGARNISGIIKHVIDIDGVLAFIHPDSSEGHDKPGKKSAATLWLGCPVDSCRELWNNASALYNVGEKSADFLFINSAQKRFSAGQNEMIDELNRYGHSAEVQKTTDTPHTFWLFNPWAPQVVEWMAEYLLKK